VWPKYAVEIDRESAREKLAAKLGVPAPAEQAPAPAEAPPAPAPEPTEPAPEDEPESEAKDDNAVVDFLQSREGRATINTVTRGALGILKGFLK
jgi:hypothetical protein